MYQQEHPDELQNNNQMHLDPQNIGDITTQIQLYPVQQPILIADPYTSRSCYIEASNIDFVCEFSSFGNKQQREAHEITKDLKKYFGQRYFFFSLFDYGIRMDRESWYSVIPEPISIHLVNRLKISGVKSVFEPFSGVGGLSVHLCGNFSPFWANDLDKNKIAMLKDNISVYGKGINQLKILNRDFFEIQPVKFDVVVACPPWGGIDIKLYDHEDLDNIMNPKLSQILMHCKRFSRNIILQMPKNTNIYNLIKIINLCFLTPMIKIEKIYINDRISQLFIYIGDTKFTGMNPNIYSKIIKDAFGVKNAYNMKEAIKDLKNKIHDQKYEIFEHLYKNSTSNKHLYFDN